MIAVDASALTMALAFDEEGAAAREQLAEDPRWVAPEHWKIEVVSSIRGLYRGGTITGAEARLVVQRLPELAVKTVPLDPLLPLVWDMRATVTAYDAVYVAIARTQRCPLVTADRRLARAVDDACEIRLVA